MRRQEIVPEPRCHNLVSRCWQLLAQSIAEDPNHGAILEHGAPRWNHLGDNIILQNIRDDHVCNFAVCSLAMQNPRVIFSLPLY
jgi:hypothetical protein